MDTYRYVLQGQASSSRNDACRFVFCVRHAPARSSRARCAADILSAEETCE